MVSFRKSALDQGISARTVGAALLNVSYNPAVIELDRSQKSFSMTYEQFYAARVTKGRVAQARQQLVANAKLLASIETRFGVQREVLVVIWALETDFGANTGSMSAFRSLATLAYDCRRSERFRGELMSALRIVERGDMSPGEMTGAWAGELGQTQFLASSYEKYAIDFDGDGRADLIRSTSDALGSTANYLEGHGWRRGESYKPGQPNFDVLESWNKSAIYRKTIALFASKIAPR
jgi:lytic murein transglycosylase